MNQNAYKEIIEGINNINHIKNLRNKIKFYSADELLFEGRKFIDKSHYLEADIVFKKLHEIKKFKELSDLYQGLIFSLGAIKFREMIHSKRYNTEPIINNIAYCMKESAKMHTNNELSNEDLLTIERLIDRVPFNRLAINKRDEFEESYCKFKEYILNVS